jgi:hypothetical protein
MERKIINVGELRKLIKESSEFKAKLGPNVESENKKNNEKSYKDSEKKTKDFDGGLKNPSKKEELDRSDDLNQGMLDYTPKTEVDDNYKKRVKAQAKGYVSVDDEKSGSKDKDGEYDDDARIYNSMKKNAEVRNKAKVEKEHSGIVGSNTEKKEKNTMYENKTPKAKRLTFKKTTFINEQQMISRIPEEYKIDGQRIYMKDRDDNEYIVECTKSEKSGKIDINILNFNNEKVLNEQMNRMSKLFGYSVNEAQGNLTNKDRVNESTNFQDILNKARELNKVDEE